MSEPKIIFVGKMRERAKIDQNPRGEYFISRRWDLSDHKLMQYLHGDGSWRPETIQDGRFTGYFQNETECMNAIANFERVEANEKIRDIPAPSSVPSILALEQKLMKIESLKRKGHYSEDKV